MKAELEWGKNQCLYRAAPYAVIYNPNTRLHEMVKPWRGPTDSTTNRSLVIEALRRELSRYPAPPIRPERVPSLALTLKELEEIETTLYPTAFHCSRCGRLLAEDPGGSVQEAARAADELASRMPSDLSCPRPGCNGRLVQWNFLTIHTCGEIIHLPTFFYGRCREHGDTDLRFDRHGSERAGDWEIVCRVPGCTWRRGRELFFFHHSDCPVASLVEEEPPARRRRSLQYSTGPIAKATNFIPRVLRILNSSEHESSPRPGSREALSVALGALRVGGGGFRFDGGLSNWIESHASSGGRSPTRDNRLRELIGQVPDPELRAKMLQEMGQDQGETGLSTDPTLRQLVMEPSYVREACAAALYNNASRSTSVEDLLADPTLAEETRESLRLAAGLRDRLHLVALRHVEDLNLTSCLIGYTRGDYDPASVRLQLYLERTAGRQQHVVYTNTVQTEGIYFQLSPSFVLDWLAKRTGEKKPVSGQYSADLLTLQASFEEAHIPTFRPPEHDWCRYYYSVLHTASHLLVRQLGKLSGLEQEGLSEEVYPFQCGGVVYVNQGAEFSLEGLRLAFEHHLREVLDGIVEESKACLYDPECEVYQGACHGCLYVAEISCAHFNRLLDRRLLSPTHPGGLWS